MAAESVTHKKKVHMKVLVLGDSGVGKTSLMNQFVHRKFSNAYKATIGADFSSKELVIDDKLVTLAIWDTAGQERFSAMGSQFYRGAEACVLCYSLTDAKSFESLQTWKDEFLEQVLPDDPEGQKAFPFVVLGTKADLATAGTRAVDEHKVAAWCAANGDGSTSVPHFETSAKECTNVDEAFLTIANKVLAHLAAAANAAPVIIPTRVKVDLDKPDAPKSCCG